MPQFLDFFFSARWLALASAIAAEQRCLLARQLCHARVRRASGHSLNIRVIVPLTRLGSFCPPYDVRFGSEADLAELIWDVR